MFPHKQLQQKLVHHQMEILTLNQGEGQKQQQREVPLRMMMSKEEGMIEIEGMIEMIEMIEIGETIEIEEMIEIDVMIGMTGGETMVGIWIMDQGWMHVHCMGIIVVEEEMIMMMMIAMILGSFFYISYFHCFIFHSCSFSLSLFLFLILN